MSLPSKAVSATGKVLLAGGYLVLDRQHTGLALGLDARIHVHARPLPTIDGVSLQEVIVKSPQFRGANWRYGYHVARDGGGVEVTQLRSSTAVLPPNLFVETALSYALTYCLTLMEARVIEPAFITILADNDYYSHKGETSYDETGRERPHFKIFTVPIEEAHKTGLGSSAALTTSFIAAVLAHYLPETAYSLSSEAGKRRLHNLSQAAHSAAQGKIGSGFDVAAAVYGSCVYRRFSPSLLEQTGELGSPDFARRLKAVVEESSSAQQWDVEITKSKATVPKGLRVVMCDVDCGSKTPGMVKKVLEWRKRCPDDSSRIWSNLQVENDKLAAELVRLANTGDSEYEALRQIISTIRDLIREMSTLSEVPIEPKAQTDLLDACSQIPGVVGGVTPGAGGYDAVALLIEDKAEVVDRLDLLLGMWKFKVGDLDATGSGRVRRLEVREGREGIREERAAYYDVWST